MLISAASLVSRLVGIMRDHTLTHYFGAGSVLDAYYAAFKIPDLIYNLLIAGALTAGFIPTFTKIFTKNEDKSEAWKLASNVITIVGVLLLVLCGLGILFTPSLTAIIAPGFGETNRALLITFTRIMFLSPFFLGISMVVGGILQSLRQFVLYSFAPVFYNLGIIYGATGIVRWVGPAGLAWGVVLGAVLHCAVQVYGAYKSNYRWRWRFDWRDANTRLIGKLMVPRTLGLAISQLNIAIVTILASYLPVGSVAVYNLANNLQGLPIGIIGIPFALAVFPVLSASVASGDGATFIKNVACTIRQIMLLIIPASILVLLLRAQIVRVVLGSGAFNWTATIATANTLAFFALGLFAQSLIHVLARAFYALSNTKTPFIVGIFAELISIIVALLLMKPLGVAGLALASSIGAIINMIILVYMLRQTTGDLEDVTTLKMLFKVSVAGIVMAVVTQILKYPLDQWLNLNRFVGILLQGLISGTVGLLAYATVCMLLGVEEMAQLKSTLTRRWLRWRNLPVGINEAEGL